MDKKMIEKLNEVEKGTIYFKNRKLVFKKIDLTVYRIVKYFADECENFAKEGDNQQYILLRAWYHSLVRMKENEMGQEFSKQPAKELDVFYEIVEEVTKSLTKEEKLEVMYRMPWHIRNLVISGNGKGVNLYFVGGIASCAEITEFGFGRKSYLNITNYDKWALDTVWDDLKEGNEEKLEFQLKNNLHTMVHALEHFSVWKEKNLDEIDQRDKHGLNIMAYILLLKKKLNVDLDAFHFYLFTLSSICFWHMESKETKNTGWKVKKGEFKHDLDVSAKLFLKEKGITERAVKHSLAISGGAMVLFGIIMVLLSMISLVIPNSNNLYSNIVIVLFSLIATVYLIKTKTVVITSKYKK